MKRTLRLLAILCLMSAITKAQAVFANADSVVSYLKGNWRWIRSCGGFSGGCITPTTTGSSSISVLFSKVAGSGDSLAYKVYQNNQLVNTAKSKVIYGTQMYSNMWSFVLQLSPMSSVLMNVSVWMAKPDSVWLSDNCYDCYQRSYVRDNSNITGLDEAHLSKRPVLYPNPAEHILNVDARDRALQFYATDVCGKRYNLPLLSEGQVNVSELPPGLYFLNIISGNGSTGAPFLKE
jgi:hypothetical protein